MVEGDGYLAVIFSVGWDFAGFGFGISIWCYNGGFGGLVWCFRVGSVVIAWLIGLVFLGGWFGGAGVSLVVKERQRLIGEREINKFLYYLFRSYIILWTKFSYKIGCNLRLQPYSISFLLEVNFEKFTI